MIILINFYINLLDKDFDSKATRIYIDHARELNGEGSDMWAYDVLDKNLQTIKNILNEQVYQKFMSIFLIKMIGLILKEY